MQAQVSTYPYSESFESGLGLWTQSSADNYNWTRDANGTASNSTGPSSGAEGAYYLYTEATGNYGKTAILNSPTFSIPSSSSVKVVFSYHMYGSNMGSLRLEMTEDNGATWNEIFYQSGDKGNLWMTDTILLEDHVSFCDLFNGIDLGFRFTGITGGGFRSDMAIDHFRVQDVLPYSASSDYPHLEDFEIAGSQNGDWHNDDGTGWSRLSGGTPNNNTGPDGSISGNYYLYMDANLNGANAQRLNSKIYTFEPGDLPVIGFSYNMFGENIGSLSLELSINCVPQSIWTKSGNQGSGWQTQVLDLTQIIPQNETSIVEFSFITSANQTSTGDIALDFIEISDLGYVSSEVTNPGGGGGGGPSPWDVQTDDGVYLSSGKVAINTDTISTDHELLVNGTISAEEVRVEVYNVPDYVFEEHYELNTLSEIEKYIDLNGHLPEVLPARVLEETGINTGEFNMLLLRKIEELTLYIIEQNKRILELENRTTNR